MTIDNTPPIVPTVPSQVGSSSEADQLLTQFQHILASQESETEKLRKSAKLLLENPNRQSLVTAFAERFLHDTTNMARLASLVSTEELASLVGILTHVKPGSSGVSEIDLSPLTALVKKSSLSRPKLELPNNVPSSGAPLRNVMRALESSSLSSIAQLVVILVLMKEIQQQVRDNYVLSAEAQANASYFTKLAAAEELQSKADVELGGAIANFAFAAVGWISSATNVNKQLKAGRGVRLEQTDDLKLQHQSNKMQQEIAELKKDTQRLYSTNTNLKKDHATFEQKLKDRNDALETYTEKRADPDFVREAQQDFRANNNNKVPDATELEDTINTKLTQDKANLTTHNATVETELDSLQQDYTNKKQTYENLKKQPSTTQQQAQLQTALDEMDQAEYLFKNKKIDKLEGDLKLNQSDRQYLQTKLTELNNELHTYTHKGQIWATAFNLIGNVATGVTSNLATSHQVTSQKIQAEAEIIEFQKQRLYQFFQSFMQQANDVRALIDDLLKSLDNSTKAVQRIKS